MLLTLMGLTMSWGPAPHAIAADVSGDVEHAGIVFVRDDQRMEDVHERIPKVWIGVRVTPVPAPLAAHIGKRGVMVANVVEQSPADAAGIQQYDVVVGFGAQEIDEPADLTEAVGKATAGEPVQLKIVRRGQAQTLEIRPAERPERALGESKLKYEEPDDVLFDTAVRLRQRALEKGPGGEWILRDLGPLEDLPEALEKLKDLDIGVDIDLPDFDVKILRDLDDYLGSEGEGERRVEVRVQVEDDGTTTTVTRKADGQITVTRTDADGKESKATYKNAGELEEADPEAFKLYRRHAGTGGMMFRFQPFDAYAPRRLKFDLQRRVEEALDRAREASERAKETYQEALKQFKKQVQRNQIEIRTDEDGEAGERKVIVRRERDDPQRSEKLMVRVNPDGSVAVAVEEDGIQTKYEFKDRQDFKQREPELYGRVRDWLE